MGCGARLNASCPPRPAPNDTVSPPCAPQAWKLMAVAPAGTAKPPELPQLLAGDCQNTPAQPAPLGVQVNAWQRPRCPPARRGHSRSVTPPLAPSPAYPLAA